MIKHSKTSAAIAAFVLSASLGANAASPARSNFDQKLKHRFTEYADVINVQPVYKQISVERPRQECWTEQREVVTYESNNRRPSNSNRGHQQRRNSAGDVIIGGIIGGVIGNQIGKHGGRGARRGATVAGAIIGSTIANEAGSNVRRHRNQRYNTQSLNNRRGNGRILRVEPVERCRQSMHREYKQQIQAYDVTYRYRGQRFTTRMNRDPGRQIELQVNVKPARQ